MKNNWQTKKLGEVCELIMGQSPDGSTYNTDGIGIPLINGPVEFGPGHFSKTIKSKFTTAPTKLCKEGDLILCVRGSTTGRTNIAGFDACIGRGVAAIRYTKYQAWINHYINSIRAKIYKLGTGSTFPNISSAILANLLVPFPSLPEQQSIVAKLDALSAETKKLEAIYQQKLADLDELKKSVLQKAFNGGLV
jgi:type I restriction enzyme S subunit